MSFRKTFGTAATLAALTTLPQSAAAFTFSFGWDGLKLCTSGRPNRVNNPAFKMKDVPKGTKFIKFRLKDNDVPGYNHGGGIVAYLGQKTITPGAFKYKSPCPPNGRHTYVWSATAQSKKSGGKLATANAARKYP